MCHRECHENMSDSFVTMNKMSWLGWSKIKFLADTKICLPIGMPWLSRELRIITIHIRI